MAEASNDRLGCSFAEPGRPWWAELNVTQQSVLTAKKPTAYWVVPTRAFPFISHP